MLKQFWLVFIVTLTCLNVESEHSKCDNSQPVNYPPPDSESSSHMVKVSVLILWIGDTFTPNFVYIVCKCDHQFHFSITDTSRWITFHHSIVQKVSLSPSSKRNAQNCTHVVKDPAAKDFYKQFPQVEASAIALEYTLKQCILWASDMRLVAYGHALTR